MKTIKIMMMALMMCLFNSCSKDESNVSEFISAKITNSEISWVVSKETNISHY